MYEKPLKSENKNYKYLNKDLKKETIEGNKIILNKAISIKAFIENA